MTRPISELTDEEFDAFISSLYVGGGYMIPYPSPAQEIEAEMLRRDPGGTRLWGGPPPIEKPNERTNE